MKILPVSLFRGLFWLLGSRLLVVTLKLFRKKKEEASRNFKNIFLFHSGAAENLKNHIRMYTKYSIYFMGLQKNNSSGDSVRQKNTVKKVRDFPLPSRQPGCH
jgi:hypothetical protein